ncbi:MAG: DUF1800 domain-containing protein [Saprospiraceae bacterium]|nr:DUF1800 domain-containing protein [Saprospiraceae bacterium]
MNRLKCTFLFFVITISAAYPQVYTDYIGAGHYNGITATASSHSGLSSPDKTLNGSGLDARLMDASRFMAQATFGADMELIEEVAEMGYENWINQQYTLPPSYILPKLNEIWNEILFASGDPELFGPWAVHFNYAWWQTNMTNQDLLRHRIAYALSQILVISINSDLRDWGEALSSYYDVLLQHAFGNYKDLLMAVSLHPSMGYYLSHLNNPKEDPDNNIRPDENYAREIMQLFTIGLYMLNQDGSRILDNNGNPVPTYTQEDIRQVAKVFTGLGGGALEDWVTWANAPYFGANIYVIDKTVPMIMFPAFHDNGPKNFMGFSIPAGQSGMTDIQQTVDFLFNHPNTPPFVAYRLIQRLVKSNPSPGYVSRVAGAFINNGQGVRGDMKAVIKAILLDPEARNGQYMDDETTGKMREPMLRYVHICRSLPTGSDRNRYWNSAYEYLDLTKQHVLASPTVFNFYNPDHQPAGDIADAGLVAPEFKLHNTATSVGYINAANAWAIWNYLMYSWEGSEGNPDAAYLLTNELEGIFSPVGPPTPNDPVKTELLINELDKVLTHGQLTDETRNILRNRLNTIYWPWNNDWIWWRVRMAIYLIMISPDYVITK